MNIILNNREEIIEKETLTVRELLSVKNFTFKMLVIKINGKLVKKDAYDIATITEGDNVIVLHLVSGG
ncbi:MAG: sulfur carrier protein ThiS [Salinivirgaceae bacterium]|nr:sulfur carrier protein ThiS [Salinivirgaceae bacterium]